MSRSFHVVLMYVIVQVGLIFFEYSGDVIDSAEYGHWEPILAGFFFHFFFLLLYLKGLRNGGGADLIGMYRRMGTLWAAVLLAPVFHYLVMANVVAIRAYAEIMTIVFLANTPLWAIMLLLTLIPFYLASRGLKTVFRTGVLVACFAFPLVLFVTFASFQAVDWRYFFPMFDRSFSFLGDISFYRSCFVYTGGFIFLGFVQPYYTFRVRSVLIAAICMVPLLLSSVYVPLLTFGDTTAKTLFLPFVVTLDTVHINWLMFERVSVFFLLSLISMILLYIALMLWITAEMTHRFLPRIRKGYLLAWWTAAVYVLSSMIPSWEDVVRLFLWNNWSRFYIMIVVPVTVYALGRRSQRGNRDEKASVDR